MRPQSMLRARKACMALGALGTITVPIGAAVAAEPPDQPVAQGTAADLVSATTSASPTAATVATSASASSTGGIPAVATRVRDIVPGARKLNVMAGRTAVVSGWVRPGITGRTVQVQRRGSRGWVTIARSTTRKHGRFVVRFRVRRSDSFVLRLRAGRAVQGIGRVNVYRAANASWYGPGLYGNSLSCGGRLTRGTLGVAHKSLPCGTVVTLRRGARILRVRVIDRGPFVSGREFDLTAATKEALRFGSVGTVLVAS